jgi:hypothetical protein
VSVVNQELAPFRLLSGIEVAPAVVNTWPLAKLLAWAHRNE